MSFWKNITMGSFTLNTEKSSAALCAVCYWAWLRRWGGAVGNGRSSERRKCPNNFWFTRSRRNTGAGGCSVWRWHGAGRRNNCANQKALYHSAGGYEADVALPQKNLSWRNWLLRHNIFIHNFRQRERFFLSVFLPEKIQGPVTKCSFYAFINIEGVLS